MLALLFLMLCLISGLLIVYRYRIPLSTLELIPAAFLIGAVLCLLWLIATCFWQKQLNGWAIGSALFLTVGTALSLSGSILRDAIKPTPISHPDLKSLIYTTVWLGMLTWAFQKLIVFEDGGIASAVTVDLSVHLTMIQHFVNGSPFPPENPFIAGYPLIYPFAINLLSAALMVLGWPLYWALLVPNVLFCACLLLLLQAWILRWTQSESAARWAIPLLLFNGGLGGLYFLCEMLLNISPRGLESPRYYTDLPELGLQFFNFIQYFLLPQRSFLLGLPVVLLILILLKAASDSKISAPECWIFAGLLTGCLPVIHTHSLIALGLVLPLWLVFNYRKEWGFYLGAAAVTGAPFVLWMLNGMRGHKSYLGHWLGGWHGWTSETGVGLFWLLNAGVLLLVLLMGQFKRSNPLALRTWTRSAQVLFILPNLLLFAPHMGDNMKLFVLWYVFCLPMASLVIAQYWQKYCLLTGLCLFLLLGAGALDVGKLLLTRRNVFALLNENDLALAEKVKQAFPANSVFLHAPVHYHPWVYTGHSSLMANASVVASYGLQPDQRIAELTSLYTSDACPKVRAFLKSHYPKVVGFYWSKQERDYFKIQKTCLTELYPRILTVGNWEVYEILPR